ncbi:MAG: nucleotidyltransferase domain-containing protein [Clostridiales bacterium]|jgi:predicted nucleotidyltransferase|nr:nucleotidyltransferase domain-containing protein [Clostridiales bacterium]
MDREEIINKVKALLADRPEVRFAYLFGSVASGRDHAGSDVDIAVRFKAGTDVMQRFNFRLALMNELPVVLNRHVDIVDLHSASLTLRHYIMRDSILLLERDKAERVRYEVASRREYFDMKHHLDRRAEAILSRL